MHVAFSFLGALVLLEGAAAVPAQSSNQKLKRGRSCGEDKLYKCFTESLALASEYCSNSLSLPSTTLTSTVIPTVTSIDESVITITTTITPAATTAPLWNRQAGSEAVQLGCLATTRTWSPSRWTSACSRIGIETLTYMGTATGEAVTAPTAVTVTQVETVTQVQTTSSTSSTSSDSSRTSSASTSASPVVTNLVQNGDFETGTLAKWGRVIYQPDIVSIGFVSPGYNNSRYALSLSIPYPYPSSEATGFVYNAMRCVTGQSYRLTFATQVRTAFQSGAPWSVTLNFLTTPIASGQGSNVSPAVWESWSHTFVCPANGFVEIRIMATMHEAGGDGGTFMFDEFEIWPVAPAPAPTFT
ncbi:hypothetical protein QBC42DRAFT_327627 [Cladorrhinum samala]|uniref:CBM-cenC domain-containing protein n=1 Tax=Cladorrhinum samala TaxID=585594 RepID=A0AAV9I4F5_9PEZI|nr:hypothetical protein QBC42DRAFT_327627 [Cladorrhinum samala]